MERPWSFDSDGTLFRLVSEAHRIRLAHLFDPVLAVHTSTVEPLPHQITAVYEEMLVRPSVAKAQMIVEETQQRTEAPAAVGGDGQLDNAGTSIEGGSATLGESPTQEILRKRFHGTVTLNPERVGRDASRIGEEVIAHLTGLVGSEVTVTLEIEAVMPGGAPEKVVRTVTENCRTLKFDNQGFEDE